MTVQNELVARIPSPLQSGLLKLIEIVEEENAILQQHRVVSHAGFTERKNHALRDLMAIQRAGGAMDPDSQCQTIVSRLSTGLKINAALLKLHISAVGEVSDIILSGLHAAESDGTYSRNRTVGRT